MIKKGETVQSSNVLKKKDVLIQQNKSDYVSLQISRGFVLYLLAS